MQGGRAFALIFARLYITITIFRTRRGERRVRDCDSWCRGDGEPGRRAAAQRGHRWVLLEKISSRFHRRVRDAGQPAAAREARGRARDRGERHVQAGATFGSPGTDKSPGSVQGTGRASLEPRAGSPLGVDESLRHAARCAPTRSRRCAFAREIARWLAAERNRTDEEGGSHLAPALHRRCHRPRHLPRQSAEEQAPQPRPRERGDLRPLPQRAPRRGRGRGQHHHHLVRARLVLVHPVEGRHHQRGRGGLAVLHEGAQEAGARVPDGHHRALADARRPAQGRGAGRGADRDRQLFLHQRLVPGEELPHGGRRLRLHRPDVLLRRAAGDESPSRPSSDRARFAATSLPRPGRARASTG